MPSPFTLDPPPAFAQKNLRIVDVGYDQHFYPSESVTVSVIVKNNESTVEFAEVDVTLVNTATGTEFTLTPVLTGNVQAGGGILTLTGTYNLSSSALVGGVSTPVTAGTYTVSFPLFDGDGTRVDRITGKFPLHVGTETESLRVFPEAIHLGGIPPGRFMHPAPIEVKWSHFRFNRLRHDHPFVIRIYTDNATRFHGIPGAIRRSSPGGLVSLDGRFSIPLKVWTLNAGPDIHATGWEAALAGPPPVEEDDFWLGPPLIEGRRYSDGASWIRVKDRVELAASPFGWARGEGLIGQDPDDNRYATEKNVTGDFTLTSPFTFYLATEAGPSAVEGPYAATLVVELWSP